MWNLLGFHNDEDFGSGPHPSLVTLLCYIRKWILFLDGMWIIWGACNEWALERERIPQQVILERILKWFATCETNFLE